MGLEREVRSAATKVLLGLGAIGAALAPDSAALAKAPEYPDYSSNLGETQAPFLDYFVDCFPDPRTEGLTEIPEVVFNSANIPNMAGRITVESRNSEASFWFVFKNEDITDSLLPPLQEWRVRLTQEQNYRVILEDIPLLNRNLQFVTGPVLLIEEFQAPFCDSDPNPGVMVNYQQENLTQDLSLRVNGYCDSPRPFLGENNPNVTLGIHLLGDINTLEGVFISAIDLEDKDSEIIFFDYFVPNSNRQNVISIPSSIFSEVASASGEILRDEPILENHRYEIGAWQGQLVGDRYSFGYTSGDLRFLISTEYTTPNCQQESSTEVYSALLSFQDSILSRQVRVSRPFCVRVRQYLPPRAAIRIKVEGINSIVVGVPEGSYGIIMPETIVEVIETYRPDLAAEIDFDSIGITRVVSPFCDTLA